VVANDATRAAPLAVLKAFTALRRSMSLYPAGHAVIDQSAEELQRAVARGLNANGRLRFDIIGGTAHVDGYPFRIESQANRELIEELEQVGVDCLQIEEGVDSEQLVAAARLINEVRERNDGPISLRQELAERGVTGVSMSKLLPVGMHRGSAESAPALPPAPRDSGYAEALESARETVGSIFEGGSPDAEAVRGLLDRLGDQIVDRKSALAEILAVKRYENHTYYHSVNVASLSVLLGRRLGLSAEILEVLAEGALLHDIGKRSIPTEIINKPGPLNRREWRIVQRHPALGAEMLVTNSGFSPLSATIALEHHRNFGGAGYPDLGETKPHLMSQIVSVTDTYEALTGARTYRAPLIPDEACLILASMAGDKLNPALVRAFVSLVTFFPLGSVVRTSEGEVGVVVDTAEREPLHPTIFTIEHPQMSARSGARINTAERNGSGAYLRHIVEALPERAPALPPEVWESTPRTVVPVEASLEEPTTEPAEASVDATADAPVDTPVEVPVEGLDGAPGDQTVEEIDSATVPAFDAPFVPEEMQSEGEPAALEAEAAVATLAVEPAVERAGGKKRRNKKKTKRKRGRGRPKRKRRRSG